MANETVVYASNEWIQFEQYGDIYTTHMAVGNSGGHPVNGAIRFTGINIANSATISTAILHLPYSSVGTTGDWVWRLRGLNDDDLGATSSDPDFPFDVDKTSTEVDYDEGEPTDGGDKKVDVTAIVEDIVDRGGWDSGSAMGFIFEDQGSDSGVFAYFDIANAWLAYRIDDEPNFKPTPKTVTTTKSGNGGNVGIKISEPGTSVLTGTDDQMFMTSKKNMTRIVAQGQVTSTGAGNTTIAHGQSGKPYVSVFAKGEGAGDNWVRLPQPKFTGTDYMYHYVDNTNLVLHASASGQKFYYYIFLDTVI